MEKALRIPVVKHVIFLYKLLLDDMRFWKAVVIRRILSLREKGLKKEKLDALLSTLGNEAPKKVFFTYAPRYFLKVFIEDLLPGIMVAGLIDVTFSLNLRTFVLTLFLTTLLFSIIDVFSYVKVELTAFKEKENIKEKVLSFWDDKELKTLDDIMKVI